MRAVLVAILIALTVPAAASAQTDAPASPAPAARTRGGDITRDEYVERRLESIGLVQLRAGAAMIDLVPRTEDEDDGRNMDHFAVRIEAMDVAAIGAHLQRHGLDPGEVRRRYGAEGYGSSIYISDPDGNTVELKGPPETAA